MVVPIPTFPKARMVILCSKALPLSVQKDNWLNAPVASLVPLILETYLSAVSLELALKSMLYPPLSAMLAESNCNNVLGTVVIVLSSTESL